MMYYGEARREGREENMKREGEKKERKREIPQRPPAREVALLRSHNHFGERRGAGSESFGADKLFFGRQRRRETLQSPVRLREPC